MSKFAIVLVATTMISFATSTAVFAQHTCTDGNLISSARHIAEGLSSPILGKIELLDAPFNARTNRYFHRSLDIQSMIADRQSQCVADVVTNRGNMLLYYGWETINDKEYVMIKLLPQLDYLNEDDTPALSKQQSDQDMPEMQPSSWREALPKVKAKCAREWPNDFFMQSSCVDVQHQGWEKLREGERLSRPVVSLPTSPSPVSESTGTPMISSAAFASQPPTSAPAPVNPVIPPDSAKTVVSQSAANLPITSTPVSTTLQAALTTSIPVTSASPPANMTANNTPLITQQPPAFTDGRNARIAYENWFSTLSGDVRSGAEFWASRRSVKPLPPTCHYQSPDFEEGCHMARQILSASDVRRKSEPQFKLGWNSF